jgi:ribonuclease P protein component
VERNKIRRRIVSFLEANLHNFKEGLDVIFIVLPQAKNKSFAQIKEATENITKILIN